MSNPYQRRAILRKIAAGPTRHLDLARGTKEREDRKHLRKITDKLKAEGLIREVHIERFPYWVMADWKMDDELRMQLLMNQCRPEGSCMVWTGYTHAERGPIVRLTKDDMPGPVRRVIWQIQRGPIDRERTVRMKPKCDDLCVKYDHMVLGRRSDKHTGRKQTMLQRKAIATSHQQRGKLDWDKVRAIRASDESAAVLALRNGVDKCTIYQVRRHETWQEHTGMFSALLVGARG